MAKAGTLTVKIVGDSKGFERTMGKVQGGMSKFATGAAKYGKVAAVGVGAAATGAFMLGQEVLNTGAKLTAWRKKTATVFEGSADDIRDWADDNNETFGVTDDQLAGLAASFGDLLKPMGFTAKQAADMSMDVVGLSGALSEWSGGQRTAAEVSDILAKAMLGEREGLKELGISITEAEVQTRLLEKGQNDLTGAALQQAKAIATQELIFEKSKDAQQAYAEGGNEALRAQNNLKAGVAELREQLADRLLPIVTKVTQWLADNLPAALDKAGQIAANLKAKWDEVFPAIKATTETVINAVRQIIETFTTVALSLWARFGDTIVRFVTESWNNVRQVIAGALNVIQGIYETFAGLFTGDWGRMWDGIKQILDGAWQAITGSVQQSLNQVRAIFSAGWAALQDVVMAGVRAVVDAFIGMAESVVGAAASAFSWVPGIGPKLKEAEAAVGRFRDDVNAKLGGIRDRQIVVDIIGRWNIPQPPSGVRAGGLAGVFHAGGTYNAPRPGGEGLALLRDGERVSTPTEPHNAGPHRDPAEDGRLMARAFASEMRRLARAG